MKIHSLSITICATALLLFAGVASAASSMSEAQTRYQQERAACMNGTSNQDRATCLKEAGAALGEAKRGAPGASSDGLPSNRMARCDALPATDREDCAMRMKHGSMSGSAQQGGILREIERPVPTR